MASNGMIQKLVAGALVSWLALAGSAVAQTPHHIRGTLTGIEGRVLSVQTPRGRSEQIKMADNVGVFVVSPADLGAVKPGKFVGVTSVEEGGKPVAREVHVFADSLRGVGEGHYPWDLESGPNMMTNADIAKVEQVGGDRVLKLNYSGGEQTIAVPPNAAIVTFDKATQDQLVTGRKVFILPKKQGDGSMAAAFVVVGANGLKPPM
ncbi:MAG: hypothetical protein M3Y41_01250 [Pseudomonadota bacterium]|nr:hypothetical protein [Pseudomonadota bacterium]